MIYQHRNYRIYLKTILGDRVANNPQYSLRSFSKNLGLAASTLSEILSGKKNLSQNLSFKISQNLGLSKLECEYFCLLTELERAKNAEIKELILDKINTINPNRESHDLSVDIFRYLSDWYHLPILVLTGVKNFEFNAGNVSKKLKINKQLAELAIDRMIRLELISYQGGVYKSTNSRWLTSSNIPNKALVSFYQKMLTKAQKALETQTPSERVSGSETFSFSTEQIEEAKDITNRYFDDILNLASKKEDSQDIFHLEVHLFNLTK